MNMKIPRTRKRISFGSAAILLIGSALLAQLLGLLRTRLVNANFDKPGLEIHPTDAYFAAFVIPDFFFFTIAAGALGVAFMPVLADHLARGDKKGIWRLSSSLMNLMAIIMFVVGILIFVFARPLITKVVAPDLDPSLIDDTVLMVRLLALNPLLFTISGVLTAAQQTFGRFFFYALAPLVYNVCIIASIFMFEDTLGIVGIGVGAFVGAVLQLVLVASGMRGTGFTWTPKIMWKSSDFRLVLRQLPPRSLDQGIDQLQSVVETRVASGLGGGAISHYNNAYTLMTAPVLLIGTAISTAAFPRLNNRLSQGRPDLFRQDFLRILRLIIWITMPVVVIGFFARGYLARLIFANYAPEIAIIFGFLCIAIFFRTVYTIISRWFYAQKDTKTPLFVSIFTICLNIVLAYWLTRPGAYNVEGLALAQSIVAAVEVTILSIIMLFRDRKLFDAPFWGGIFRIVSVTGFSLLAGYIAVSYLPLSGADSGFVMVAKLCTIAGVTLATHVSLSGLFGLDEVRPFFNWLKRIVLRPVKVDY
jgi:putative peptidoglycan lipid II flippase